MDITSLDHSSFRIKGKLAAVLIEQKQLRIEDRAGASPYEIHGPGEYEVKGVGVIGCSVPGATIYRIEIDGVSVLYLGGLVQPLTSAQVDALDGVDILIVPVGVLAVIKEIEPSIVIPTQYDPQGLSAFLKELGKDDIAPQPKLSVTRDKLPDQMQVVVLE